MKYTVLGASGYVGRHLVEALRAEHKEVYAPKRGDDTILSENLGHVIYAIGITSDFRTKPFETVEAHVSYLSKVLQSAKFGSFLYLSSTRVYRINGSAHENAPISVEPSNPTDVYNISKVMGESLCLSSGHGNMRVARLSNVVGKRFKLSNDFSSSIIRDALSGQIQMQSSCQSVKDYVYIDDVVNWLVKISERGKSKIYNLASGVQTSHAELTEKVREITGCNVFYDIDAPNLSFPPIDIALVRDEFGHSGRNIIDLVPSLIDDERQLQVRTE